MDNGRIKITKEEVIKRYGLNPEDIGLRHRGWWVVDELDFDDEYYGVEIGDLCVEARDGDEPDMDVGKYENYRCSYCDPFDRTYRYYFFKPLFGKEGLK